MMEFIEQMDPAVLVLVGAALPAILAVLNRYHWEASTKALVALVVTLGVGVVAGLANGITSREGLVSCAAAVYIISQGAFLSSYRPSGLADWLERKVLPGSD